MANSYGGGAEKSAFGGGMSSNMPLKFEEIVNNLILIKAKKSHHWKSHGDGLLPFGVRRKAHCQLLMGRAQWLL